MPMKVYWVLAVAFAAVGWLVLWNGSGGVWWFSLIGGLAGVVLWFILGTLSVFETLYTAFTEGPGLRRATNIVATLAAFVLLAWQLKIISDGEGGISSLLMVTLPAIVLLAFFPFGLYDKVSRAIRGTAQQQPVVTPLIPTGPAQAEPARQPQRATAGLNIWLRLGLGLVLGVVVNIVDYFLYATILAGFGTIVVVMAIVYEATRPRPEVDQQPTLVEEASRVLDRAQVESAAALVTYRDAQQTLSDAGMLLDEIRTARQTAGLTQQGGDEPQATDDPQGSGQEDPFGELDQEPKRN